MDLQPLGDRLIVEVLEEEETTVSGIVLPDTAKEKPQRGRVLAVGPGARDEDGRVIPMDVAEGDEIIFSKYGGTEIKVGADDVLILRESDVLAKVVTARRARASASSPAPPPNRNDGGRTEHGSQGAEVQRGRTPRARARREHPRRRGQGDAWPEGPLRRAGQEVRRADDHERRRHDRP